MAVFRERNRDRNHVIPVFNNTNIMNCKSEREILCQGKWYANIANYGYLENEEV